MRKPRPATFNPAQALHLIAKDRSGSPLSCPSCSGDIERYPDYVPPSKTVPANGTSSPAAPPGKPSVQNSVRPAADTTTVAMNTPRTAFRSGNSLAGFKAPNDLEKAQGCATCGKK